MHARRRLGRLRLVRARQARPAPRSSQPTTTDRDRLAGGHPGDERLGYRLVRRARGLTARAGDGVARGQRRTRPGCSRSSRLRPGVEAVRRSRPTARPSCSCSTISTARSTVAATGTDLLTGQDVDGRIAVTAGGVAVVREALVTALAPQRQQRILEEVRRRGGVRVSDLVELLGVSDMTIRRDLEVLAGAGCSTRCTAARPPRSSHATDEPGFAAKSGRELQREGRRSRAAAAELVEPGTAVALSAGTTTWALARFLVEVPRLTVVTNSIPVADVFYAAGGTDQTVVLTGGVRTPVRRAGRARRRGARCARCTSTCCSWACTAWTCVRGFTTPNLMEAETEPRAGRRGAHGWSSSPTTRSGAWSGSATHRPPRARPTSSSPTRGCPAGPGAARSAYGELVARATPTPITGRACCRGHADEAHERPAGRRPGDHLLRRRPTTPSASSIDPRDLPEAPTASEIRYDVAARRVGRDRRRTARRARTCRRPTSARCARRAPSDQTEIPSPDYDVVVFENRFPSFAENVAGVDP